MMAEYSMFHPHANKKLLLIQFLPRLMPLFALPKKSISCKSISCKVLYYNITKFIPIITMRAWFLSLLFFVPALASADDLAEKQADETYPRTTHIRVVASIKPIHSLVAGVMHGIGQPELLLSSSQSPHHASLRPSERRKLTRADLIFWIGPSMESFMPRLLSSLDDKTQIISLIDINGLTLHPARRPDHDSEHHDDNRHTQIDAHIWLNTHNIEIMIDEITRQLVSLDPENSQQYRSNNKILHEKTKTLRNKLGSLLKDKQQPFLTYHDGYQYFEQEFNLKNVGFVSRHPELRPSARHIHAMKKLIRKHSIECVFYDAPVEPPIMTSLLTGNQAKAVELDPMGIKLPSDKLNLFQIMRTMGGKFQNCL
jgi:zinc transport system substrate-binding protein